MTHAHKRWYPAGVSKTIDERENDRNEAEKAHGVVIGRDWKGQPVYAPVTHPKPTKKGKDE